MIRRHPKPPPFPCTTYYQCAVRKHLRHVQKKGLVTAGNRGMLRVNSLSAAEVHELFRVRDALEGLAVREVIGSRRREADAAPLRRAGERPSEDGAAPARVGGVPGFHPDIGRRKGRTSVKAK